MAYFVGLDVGSTTVKVAVFDANQQVVFSLYRRHRSDVKETVRCVLEALYDKLGDVSVHMNVTGSGGMFVETVLGIPFVQEVIAETTAIRKEIPQTDVIIELGGEDSKITYLAGNIEQRMNSICAGGTGAFIDQMAALLDTDAGGLNQLADAYTKLYPIASRCGVFAKTDVQALLNDGASKEDIAMSVLQSVVNQTISNLACGRPIRGNVTFLGGPLHFLSNLRARFMETLGEENNRFYAPEDAQLFVAKGAAYSAQEGTEAVFLRTILARFDDVSAVVVDEQQTLDPLFTSQEEYDAFLAKHHTQQVLYKKLEAHVGPCYLGIDAGSTTSKMVLLDDDGAILYSHYSNNRGKPLEHVIENVKEIYARMRPDVYIAYSGITGYGEDFIKAAIGVDTGEVETIAHYTAARYFDPEVDFILDIGGQDMKAMHISDGVIDSIQLNEACSSGCGSFLETFASTVDMDAKAFQKEALFAAHPTDLGSRCTVFMNSKVKQAQKQGAEVGDIAAGLCYSVIKNAIQKVIKVRDPKRLGRRLVVQGGTFYGDAILRAFEKITGRHATRPSIAGLMGAMGMALIARDRSTGLTRMKSAEELQNFSYKQRNARCGRCTNNCALTINVFSDGRRYISGNRCERGAGIKREASDLPNLFKYKYERLFHYYSSLSKEQACYPEVGIPRVLNMYENYPFWHTFFTRLGFPVRLSARSSRELYDKGLASISSETVCYPGKMVHGHIEDLVERGVKFIFYPSVFYETQEFHRADNHVNCPVVAGFPEVIKNNVASIDENGVAYLHPFLSFQDQEVLARRLVEVFDAFEIEGVKYHIDAARVRKAAEIAWREQDQFKEDIREEGARAIAYVRKEKGRKGIVLCGRPYHIDPEIHHGIPELINSMGLAVLSEDAVAYNMKDISKPLRVLDQWVYHSRLYRAAEFVAKDADLELIQLNSFGCGLDAVTTDQVADILRAHGKIYTLLKIDEVSNLGAIKIRIRSLVQALEERVEVRTPEPVLAQKAVFTRDMRKDGFTILVPAMAPDHFRILDAAMTSEGYKMDFLPRVDRKVIDAGLKYVNNDSCYPSITVVGQMMEALESGRYDPNRVALLMTQTGGACRASNYVGYIRKALQEMGHPQIPVIALSAQSIESSPGFRVTPRLLKKGVISLIAGDLLMRCANATRPYECHAGETDRVKERWIEAYRSLVQKPRMTRYRQLVQQTVREFDRIPRRDVVKPKAGIVGEILVKYLPEANNHLQDLLEAEGAEVVLPDLVDFFLYCLRNAKHKADLLKTNRFKAQLVQLGVHYIEYYRAPARHALRASTHFTEPFHIEQVERFAEEVVALGHQYGEGWLLSGEMIELIHEGAPNIVCIQPFGCLPNHITGKGVMKSIREKYPQANIVAIDYDPGASEVNQINRIKLMMTSARESVREEEQSV
uniref:2-hydroxyacyl-CoA dehydratase n=1 Tax=Ndongobacter massiliensis TaxID=1871025 RepID=UPI00092FEA83|nr:2-hydroxyacyl-CoA dehydratase [Ndongobacter massiliensis]